MAAANSGRIDVSDGLYISYRIEGSGGEPLVVPSMSWLGDDMGPLSADRQVVFYDLRGRGRSAAVLDEDLLGIDKDVADLEVLRRELSLDRMSLLGWSYHGAMACRYALANPQRVSRLLMCGPTAPKQQPYYHGFLDRFARLVDFDGLIELEKMRKAGGRERDLQAWAEAVHRLYFRAYTVDDRCVDRMRSSPAVAPNLDAERVNNQGRRVLEKLGAYDWRDDFGSFDVPVLIVHGVEDPVLVSGSELWLEVLPNARLLRLEQVGHMPWLEVPETFFPVVSTFFAGDWPAAAKSSLEVTQ